MKRFKVILAVVLLLFSFVFVNAAQNMVVIGGPKQNTTSGGDPISASTLAAQQNTNKFLWFGAGCLFGLLGIGAAYLVEPNPPASALVGKDSSYVAQYTDNYRRVAKGIQTKQAIWGCVASSVVYILYYVFVVALVASASDTYTY